MRTVRWGTVRVGDVISLKGRSWWVSGVTPDGIYLTDPRTRAVQQPGRPPQHAKVTVLDPEDRDYVAPPSTLVFDVETADSDELFRYGPDFVRLSGWTCSGSDCEGVTTTPDVEELLAEITSHDEIVGHNILGFDLIALCHTRGLDWPTVAARARDTLILSRLADPPRARRDDMGSADRYNLDAVAERFGVVGKTDDLRKLKREFGGYDKIPVDDPRYVSYLHGDVRSSAAVARHLPMTPYGQREHRLASLAGSMTLSGFRVDLPLLEQRIKEGQERKAAALETLHETYELPVSRTVMRGRGKAKHPVVEPFSSPLATTEAQPWLRALWQQYKVRNAPRTPKGKFSSSATDLAAIAAHPRCPEELRTILDLMAIVTRTRTVYQTVADCLAGDRCHPLVNMGQASGRWSVTRPGLTVFGKRGGRHHERDVFLPEEGHVLLSCDLSQVDMRGIAGHCQDPNYMALFQPGRDVHMEIARAIFGDEAMDTPEKAKAARHEAKARGHGYNYGLGQNAMIRDGADPEKVAAFFEGMERQFPLMISWRDDLRERAGRGELLDNGFGRKMRCEPERAFTQAPALMGQGAARDLMCEALLRLPEHFRPYLRVMIHDEIVVSVPEDLAAELGEEIREAFTYVWRDVPILCDLSAPGRTWGEVSAK